jgi:hypothetical protein
MVKSITTPLRLCLLVETLKKHSNFSLLSPITFRELDTRDFPGVPQPKYAPGRSRLTLAASMPV